MTLFPFNNAIPAAPNNPSDDQPLMLINNINLPLWAAVDHNGFNVNNGGFHTIIHQDPNVALASRTWDPVAKTFTPAVSPLAGFNQLFTAFYTPNYVGAVPDTQLFSLTGNGGPSQLTGYNAIANGGWAWVGGILLQWGFVSTASTTVNGTVTFALTSPTSIPFPTNCFFVGMTPYYTGSTPTNGAEIAVDKTTLSKTKFDWLFTTNSSSYAGFFWFALGN